MRIHLFRDHAAWCPYCQKVWMLLEEKRIPYTVEKINMRCYGDKPPSFLAKVPAGLLPVLELDGRVIAESARIMELLEQEFPARPMMPAPGTDERACALLRPACLVPVSLISVCSNSWAMLESIRCLVVGALAFCPCYASLGHTVMSQKQCARYLCLVWPPILSARWKIQGS